MASILHLFFKLQHFLLKILDLTVLFTLQLDLEHSSDDDVHPAGSLTDYFELSCLEEFLELFDVEKWRGLHLAQVGNSIINLEDHFISLEGSCV